jgi:hypothetical protein
MDAVCPGRLPITSPASIVVDAFTPPLGQADIKKEEREFSNNIQAHMLFEDAMRDGNRKPLDCLRVRPSALKKRKVRDEFDEDIPDHHHDSGRTEEDAVSDKEWE